MIFFFKRAVRRAFFLCVGLGLGLATSSQLRAGAELEGFDYPFEMKKVRLYTQQQELDMAYAELQPAQKERGTVVLLHGLDWGGFSWKETAEALSAAGFRVIIPDQIGCGKSAKPPSYQYSAHQLADNTRTLVQRLGFRRVHLVGHDLGGLIAARHALIFPEEVVSLTLVNPLGLDGATGSNISYQGMDAHYQEELQRTSESVRADQRETIFAGEWKEEYDLFIRMFETFRRSPDYSRVAWNRALLRDMISTQPLGADLSRISQPTLLLFGQKKAVRPELARATYQAIAQAQLVEWTELGPAPQVEASARFTEALLKFLRKPVGDKKKS
jgi:pimeloyl-ACP methyl ester carboxylesterase